MFKFIETNVASFDDKRGLKSSVNTLYRENTMGVINPQEFAETHFPEDLLRIFGSEVGSNYPSSFTKDLALVDRSLNRGHIRLVDDLTIAGPQDAIDNVSISNGQNFDIEHLRMQIENGEIRQVVTIKAE